MESAVVDFDGCPFELRINFAYYNNRPMPGFSWLWQMTIPVEKDERSTTPVEEMNRLQAKADTIVQHIREVTEIHYIGNLIHKTRFQLMFYARKEDAKEIGGAIIKLTEQIENSGQSFPFKAEEDEQWEQVKYMYMYLASTASPDTKVNHATDKRTHAANDMRSAVIKREGYPLELSVNYNYYNKRPVPGFNVIWCINQLVNKEEQNTTPKEEVSRLECITVSILEYLTQFAALQFVGTTIHKKKFELIFYARDEDTRKIGGEIAGLPETITNLFMEDRISFKFKPDEKWEEVKHLYLVPDSSNSS